MERRCAEESTDIGGEEEEVEVEEALWNKETIPRVMKIVCTCIKLHQRDLISLLLVSPWLHRTLISHPSIWLVIDLHEMNNAGDRLVAALSLPRYHNVKNINLEFARDIEDKNFEILKSKFVDALKNLESLNLNGCQKISDKGVEVITSICPNLAAFSIYWNVRVTDIGVKHLVRNCKRITDLNLSGCKNITEQSLHLIADNYRDLESLNLTRCIKLTDGGLQQILLNCYSLQSLNLYALSSFTDEAYKKISLLSHLRFLDLCGAQNLTDDGLRSIANCRKLVSLNLTWCIHVTDVGVKAIAESCSSLELLSLFGIVGVTDRCLEALCKCCSGTLTTLDVNGCVGIKVLNMCSTTCGLTWIHDTILLSGHRASIAPSNQVRRLDLTYMLSTFRNYFLMHYARSQHLPMKISNYFQQVKLCVEHGFIGSGSNLNGCIMSVRFIP
ncbi:F-box protein At3g58530-like isoform X1 [Coffea arabica]|uniref:F-box protein At3g58530-like isoform X1 n=1 Tax=Coffea arabica TaxID=13443 RepID=A0A6P6SU97_COFAR|nr:F-box protein At3g58530-like isoform X1 [Coffea arabica]